MKHEYFLCVPPGEQPLYGMVIAVLTDNREYQFRTIYAEHYAYLMGIIAKRVGNEHDAEEICQNLFVAMYRKMDEIENPAKWLRASVGFEILSFLKSRKRNDSVTLEDVEEQPDRAEQSEISIIIRDAIDDPGNFDSERDMTLFRLIAVYKYSYIEAARELGISRRQAEYGYGKASHRLMEHLRGKGIGVEDAI